MGFSHLDDKGRAVMVEIPSHGSGDFVSACLAEGVFEIPPDASLLPAGEIVRFHPLWG